MTHDELIRFLDSDANQFGLDSVATHGFLTATVVGKPLKDWHLALFEMNHEQLTDSIKLALFAWQLDIINQLKSETPIELPFADGSVEVDYSPQSDIAAWSVGFVDAMYADEAPDWFLDDETEEDVAMLTLPMVVFSGIDEDDDTLKAMRNDEDLLAQMANNIEGNVTELFLLFHTQD